jgi:hypothetical protein
VKFDWDPAKAATNARKHGVSQPEVETVFADPFAVRVYDEKHSAGDEERWILLGRSSRDRILFVVFLEINELKVRLISARKATTRESRNYEEKRQNFGG